MCLLFFFSLYYSSPFIDEETSSERGMICPRSQSWDLSSMLLILECGCFPQATRPGTRSATWWRTQVQGHALARRFTWLPQHQAARLRAARVTQHTSSQGRQVTHADLNHFLLSLQTFLTWLQTQRWFPNGPHTRTHGAPWTTRGPGHTGEGLLFGGDTILRGRQEP